jgi:NTP pyrophosphatase (non-canonical NTP hydrolase)
MECGYYTENKEPLPTPAEVYQVAVKNGKYKDESPYSLLEDIWHELNEAKYAVLSRIPEGQPHCLSEELADIVLVTFSLAEHLEIDIISAIARKHQKNKGE